MVRALSILIMYISVCYFDTLDLLLQIYLLLKSSPIILSSNIRLLSYFTFRLSMNKTIFVAAVLAAATVLTAGLTVLPSSVQEARANPCSTYDTDTVPVDIDAEYNCDFDGIGSMDIEESE
jgi:hypothetical protein